ncbi:MAG: hypothetical protein PVI50_04965, partial [Gammaproteobacteria bacterium]
MPRPQVRPPARLVLPGTLLLLALLLAAGPAPTPAAATPADLEAWSDWVVQDIEDYGCPMYFNADSRRCAFPGHLELALDAAGGTFRQTWHVYRETRVRLPGDREHWPLAVTLDDTAVAVTGHQGRPALTLERGRHRVQGRFRWAQLPAALDIPPGTGLVRLQLDGRPVARPDVRNGQLWLSDTRAAADTTRRVDLKVFRKITDAVPLMVSTRIELEVSGEPR